MTEAVGRGRVTYATAGRAMRAAIERANKVRLSLFQWRVLNAVFVITGTYSRLQDQTSTRQVAALVFGIDRDDIVGWQRLRVGKALRVLADRDVIEYEPGRGRNARSLVGLPERGVDPEHPSEMRVEPALVSENGHRQDRVTSDPFGREMRVDPVAEMRVDPVAKRGNPSGPLREVLRGEELPRREIAPSAHRKEQEQRARAASHDARLPEDREDVRDQEENAPDAEVPFAPLGEPDPVIGERGRP